MMKKPRIVALSIWAFTLVALLMLFSPLVQKIATLLTDTAIP